MSFSHLLPPIKQRVNIPITEPTNVDTITINILTNEIEQEKITEPEIHKNIHHKMVLIITQSISLILLLINSIEIKLAATKERHTKGINT